MEWAEVERRIRAGEDAVTEFKRGVGDMRAVGRTLCAFANGAGGLLVLGVDDAGATVGVSASSDAVQERFDRAAAHRLRETHLGAVWST